jgi:GNAT superfamily N-acetyltransferase
MNDMTSHRPPVVTIRAVRRDDLPDLAAMVAELAAYHGDAARLTGEDLDRDLFGPMPWIRALVAEGEGGLIGFALLTPHYRASEGARGLEIHQLFVRPAFRSHGVGQHLVTVAREEARRLGCTYLTVGAATGNFRAHRFYETLSFTPRPVTGMRYQQVVAG